MLGCEVSKNNNIYVFVDQQEIDGLYTQNLNGIFVNNNLSRISTLELLINKDKHASNKMEDAEDAASMILSINMDSYDKISKEGTYLYKPFFGELRIINSSNGMSIHEKFVYYQLLQVNDLHKKNIQSRLTSS